AAPLPHRRGHGAAHPASIRRSARERRAYARRGNDAGGRLTASSETARTRAVYSGRIRPPLDRRASGRRRGMHMAHTLRDRRLARWMAGGLGVALSLVLAPPTATDVLGQTGPALGPATTAGAAPGATVTVGDATVVNQTSVPLSVSRT